MKQILSCKGNELILFHDVQSWTYNAICNYVVDQQNESPKAKYHVNPAFYASVWAW